MPGLVRWRPPWAPRRPSRAIRPWRGSPWSRDLDRWFERMEEEFESLVPWSDRDFDLDMYETDTAIVVEASLPGVKADDVDISLTGNTLSLKGEVKEETEEERGDYHYQERHYGKFQRSVMLPTEVIADEATAEFKDGVLKLTLPKAEETERKTINISAK